MIQVFSQYQYWLGFTIGLSLISMIFYRARKFYKNAFVVLTTIVIAILFIIPAVTGFTVHLVMTGYQRGFEAYDDFINWLRIT